VLTTAQHNTFLPSCLRWYQSTVQIATVCCLILSLLLLSSLWWFVSSGWLTALASGLLRQSAKFLLHIFHRVCRWTNYEESVEDWQSYWSSLVYQFYGSTLLLFVVVQTSWVSAPVSWRNSLWERWRRSTEKLTAPISSFSGQFCCYTLYGRFFCLRGFSFTAWPQAWNQLPADSCCRSQHCHHILDF